MTYFHRYIYLINFLKIIFAILSISNLYLKATGEKDSDLDKIIVYWKERVEFVFKTLMALLLMYLFNPRHDHRTLIDSHVKLLLYLFGFILLVGAKWGIFFGESKWFKDLQSIITNED